MTGFGKAECVLPEKKITVEIKSLNSKQLDVISRISGVYKSKDIELRKEISKYLARGKVELSFYIETIGVGNSSINESIVGGYIIQLKGIADSYGLNVTDRVLQIAVGLPDSIKLEKEELDEGEWNEIIKSVRSALEAVNKFRVEEGKSLDKDIFSNIILIQDLLSKVGDYEESRIKAIKERLLANLKEVNNGEGIDENRFEQEMIYYLEKLDINEEKVRLANHCEFFLETMAADEPVGKKLGFISQEIGREINTLGSKAGQADIQKLVIEMKDALERIKEQLLNVL